MEEKLSSGGHLMPGGPYGCVELRGPMQFGCEQNPCLDQQGSSVQLQFQDGFNLQLYNLQKHDRPAYCVEHNKRERGKNSGSDDDEMNCVEEGIDGHDEVGKGKEECPWHRMKWTEKMVKLLITIVSYIGEDASSDCTASGRRKASLLLKKGKWKCVSEVMADRGHRISPQQCEDKFNDLNKRYKKLNDILGRGTSCKVVENPKLLDVMDLPMKAKEDVRKILSSKHLFYEEMCSYHNGNRLYIPHDPDVQRSLQLALGTKDDCEPHDLMRKRAEDFDGEDHDAEAGDQDEENEENDEMYAGFHEVFAKRLKRRDKVKDSSFWEHNRGLGFHLKNDYTDLNHVYSEGGKENEFREQWMTLRSLQLRELELQIKAQMLELEKQHLKWQRFSWKQERELEKLRLENESMKIENELMALELNRKKMLIDES